MQGASQTELDRAAKILSDFKRRKGRHLVQLQIVETHADASTDIRVVDVQAATEENVRYLTTRAETFASSGIPAALSELLSIGPTADSCVTRTRYFQATFA
jgi:hypothetical protein